MVKKFSSHNNIDLLRELVKTSFILKYNGSFLGFLWVLLKPFMQFTILFVVFSNFSSNKDIESFVLYLLIGIIIFSFASECISGGVTALLSKGNIILKVNFDKTLVIYSSIALAIINLSINFLIIIIFSLFNSIHPSIESIIYFLYVMFIMIISFTGIGFFTSIITVRLRDLQHIVEIALQLLFYSTPIIYQISALPEPARSILSKNPIFIFIQASREAIINGHISFLKEMIVITIISFAIFLLGYFFFQLNVKKVAEHF